MCRALRETKNGDRVATGSLTLGDAGADGFEVAVAVAVAGVGARGSVEPLSPSAWPATT